ATKIAAMSAPIVPPPITATCSIVASSMPAKLSGDHNAARRQDAGRVLCSGALAPQHQTKAFA
ncbi:MAG: hypothetical protein WCE38_13720, partial [Burkholderiales bacterium]